MLQILLPINAILVEIPSQLLVWYLLLQWQLIKLWGCALAQPLHGHKLLVKGLLLGCLVPLTLFRLFSPGFLDAQVVEVLHALWFHEVVNTCRRSSIFSRSAQVILLDGTIIDRWVRLENYQIPIVLASDFDKISQIKLVHPGLLEFRTIELWHFWLISNSINNTLGNWPLLFKKSSQSRWP